MRGKKSKKVEASSEFDGMREKVKILETSIDDMSAELLALACEKLFEAGALDVFTESIYMKKGRIGHKITCIAPFDSIEGILKCFFTHTSTIGVRIREEERIALEREIQKLDTTFGELDVKVAKSNERLYGVYPEFESLKDLAMKSGISAKDVIAGIDLFKKLNNDNLE